MNMHDKLARIFGLNDDEDINLVPGGITFVKDTKYKLNATEVLLLLLEYKQAKEGLLCK